MEYKIIEVDELPCIERVRISFYETIIKEFLSLNFKYAKVEVPGRKFSSVVNGLKRARKKLNLEGKIGIVKNKKEGVFLINHGLVEL